MQGLLAHLLKINTQKPPIDSKKEQSPARWRASSRRAGSLPTPFPGGAGLYFISLILMFLNQNTLP